MGIREAFEVVAGDPRLIRAMKARRKGELARADLLPSVLVEAEWDTVKNRPDVADRLVEVEHDKRLRSPHSVDVHVTDGMRVASAVFVAGPLTVLAVCGRVERHSPADTYLHWDDGDLWRSVSWHPGLEPAHMPEERLTVPQAVLSRLCVRTAWHAIGAEPVRRG